MNRTRIVALAAVMSGVVLSVTAVAAPFAAGFADCEMTATWRRATTSDPFVLDGDTVVCVGECGEGFFTFSCFVEKHESHPVFHDTILHWTCACGAAPKPDFSVCGSLFKFFTRGQRASSTSPAEFCPDHPCQEKKKCVKSADKVGPEFDPQDLVQAFSCRCQ